MEQLTKENAYVGLEVIVSNRTSNSDLVGKTGPIKDIVGGTVLMQCLPVDLRLLIDRFDIIDGQVMANKSIEVSEKISLSDRDWGLLTNLLNPNLPKLLQL